MSTITRRLATTAATFAVAGGILFAAGGAASAAAPEGQNHGGAATSQSVQQDHRDHRWDGKWSWDRHDHRGWYSNDHGSRYWFDGHRFYQWRNGKWRPVSAHYGHRHGFDGRHFGDRHHGDSGHSGHGH